MIVITGGAGFIGSALVKRLIEKGRSIKVIDINAPKIDVEFSKIDLIDYNSLKNEINCGDTVVHLAALTNAHESDNEMEKYFRTNVEGTFNVVRVCKESKAKKIVFASSIAVFDPKLEGVIDEESEKRPQNFYGVTKVIGEELVRNSGIKHAILRFTNVYGPGGRGVINIFVKRAMSGEPVEIWGDGSQERDFLHVGDVVGAIMQALDKGNGSYNIAYGKNFCIKEVANRIIELTRSKSRVVYRETNEIPVKYLVSNAKAKKELEWNPKISLEEGIRGLIQ